MGKTIEPEIETGPAPEPRKGFVGRIVETLQNLGPVKGALLGAAVAAVAVVGVMALVAGTMGSGAITGFSVGMIPVTTFEEGIGHGIAKGFEFLTQSAMGWITMGAGALAGVGGAYVMARTKEQNTPDSPEHANLLEMTQGRQKQKEIEAEAPAPQQQAAQQQPQPRNITNNSTQVVEQNTLIAQQNNNSNVSNQMQAPAPERAQASQAVQDSIYLANSTIKGQGFTASELKRRVERQAEYKTVV